jgi:hypothetical protein
MNDASLERNQVPHSHGLEEDSLVEPYRGNWCAPGKEASNKGS